MKGCQFGGLFLCYVLKEQVPKGNSVYPLKFKL
jgi:hypothetical protein